MSNGYLAGICVASCTVAIFAYLLISVFWLVLCDVPHNIDTARCHNISSLSVLCLDRCWRLRC